MEREAAISYKELKTMWRAGSFGAVLPMGLLLLGMVSSIILGGLLMLTSLDNPIPGLLILAIGIYAAWLIVAGIGAPESPVFSGGFESGDTSAWSEAVPRPLNAQPAGFTGICSELPAKLRDRALWSKMAPSPALAGEGAGWVLVGDQCRPCA